MNFNKLTLKPLAIALVLASSVAIAQSKDQDSYFLLGKLRRVSQLKMLQGERYLVWRKQVSQEMM